MNNVSVSCAFTVDAAVEKTDIRVLMYVKDNTYSRGIKGYAIRLIDKA